MKLAFVSQITFFFRLFGQFAANLEFISDVFVLPLFGTHRCVGTSQNLSVRITISHIDATCAEDSTKGKTPNKIFVE